MFDTLKTQRELASLYGPAGQESIATNRILEMAKPYADECSIDTLGNLIIRKKGDGRRIMLSAHVDTIGIVVTHIDEKGFLRFCSLGGVSTSNIIGKSVAFGRGINGVVGCEEKTKLADLKIHNCFIDIGACDRDSARKLVNIGDMAVFCAETYTVNNKIISPYLDDRIGCVVLLQVLSMLHSPINDIYFVFSVQEEVGTRGAKTAAYAIDPEIALAIDVTATGDTPEKISHMECYLGSGAAIKIRDNSILSHPKIVKLLEQTAEQQKIPVQREVLTYGGTDAGAIHVSRSGVYTGAVSIPTRYVHSPAEMADLSDIEACTRLILATINSKIDI